ncbi:MAG: hypothetical protein M4D80_28155 [Myxococcota bacterium]|nr:hypothetical protein [Myxococcota bacterium]
MRRQWVGRFIGATGAACASLLWGFIVLSVIALLLEPSSGWRTLGLIIAMPVGAVAAVLLIISVADVIVLARGADVAMPWRVAGMHLCLAVVVLWGGGTRAWLAASVLLAVSATQVIAIRIFQMTPSHASSQR